MQEKSIGNRKMLKLLETFGNHAPKRQLVYRIRNKVYANGSLLNAPKAGRPKTGCKEDIKQNIPKHLFIVP